MRTICKLKCLKRCCTMNLLLRLGSRILPQRKLTVQNTEMKIASCNASQAWKDRHKMAILKHFFHLAELRLRSDLQNVQFNISYHRVQFAAGPYISGYFPGCTRLRWHYCTAQKQVWLSQHNRINHQLGGQNLCCEAPPLGKLKCWQAGPKGNWNDVGQGWADDGVGGSEEWAITQPLGDCGSNQGSSGAPSPLLLLWVRYPEGGQTARGRGLFLLWQ